MAFELTNGARHDVSVFQAVFDQCPAMPQLAYEVIDKRYDSDPIRQHLHAREVTPVIPPWKHCKTPILYDVEQYKLREKVECFFNKLKHLRRIVTRYEKLSQTFLALIYLVALLVMIS